MRVIDGHTMVLGGEVIFFLFVFACDTVFLERNVKCILIHEFVNIRTHIAMNLNATADYVIYCLAQFVAKDGINVLKLLYVAYEFVERYH